MLGRSGRWGHRLYSEDSNSAKFNRSSFVSGQYTKEISDVDVTTNLQRIPWVQTESEHDCQEVCFELKRTQIVLVNYSKPAFKMQIWIVWISLMESVMRTACASNKKKVLFQATENWLWEGWPKGVKLKASSEWLLKQPSEFPNFLIQMQETKAAAFIQGESLAKGKCSYDIVITHKTCNIYSAIVKKGRVTNSAFLSDLYFLVRVSQMKISWISLARTNPAKTKMKVT